ncbi:MAG: BrnA antitoxin family protein [Chloroflexi bacterium]|nr:BrnA antitoxin family protein [Chloroflexota bacterium]
MSRPKPTVDLGYPTEAHGRIPAFTNVEEEAAFWDTHDFTDFAEESTPVQLTVGRERAERRTLRLDQADRQELAKHAREKGIGPSTLARIWLKERLRQETAAKSGSS